MIAVLRERTRSLRMSLMKSYRSFGYEEDLIRAFLIFLRMECFYKKINLEWYLKSKKKLHELHLLGSMHLGSMAI